MTRAEKISLLTNALRGNWSRLDEMKQQQRQKVFVFVTDGAPANWREDNIAVKARYRLDNQDELTEYLTYTQMRTMARGAVLYICPDKHRRIKPE